jgi:hypothetical protein
MLPRPIIIMMIIISIFPVTLPIIRSWAIGLDVMMMSFAFS